MDELVVRARSRQRWLSWPVVLGGVLTALVGTTQLTLLEVPSTTAVEVVRIAGTLFAGLVLLVVWGSQRLHIEALAIAEPFDHMVAVSFAPSGAAHRLLTSLRRWQGGLGLLLVASTHWMLFAPLWLLLEQAERESILWSFLTSAGFVAAFLIAWVRLERVAAPWHQGEALPSSAQTSLALVSSRPEATPSPASSSSLALAARAVTPLSVESSSTVQPGARPPDSSTTSVASEPLFSSAAARERRSWRVAVALVACAVVPQLIDALAVILLQGGAPPSTSGLLLHQVMPSLPAAVAVVCSALTPLALLLSRPVVDRRFLGPFTWLWSLALLCLPATLSVVHGVVLRTEFNAHLWAYSWSIESLELVLGQECNVECQLFFGASSVALGARALRFVAVVVLAAGLRRVLGKSRLRTTVSVLLAGQVTVWVATLFLHTPDLWRGLVDVIAAVGLLLVAVFGKPAFEQSR